MARLKKPNPRNARRGTRPTPFRLGDETLADLDLIATHLSRPDGLPRSRADAVRVAVRLFAEKIRQDLHAKTPENPGVS